MKPGFFAAKGEKQLFRLLQQAKAGTPHEHWLPAILQVANEKAKFRTAALAVAGIFSVHSDPATSLASLRELFTEAARLEDDLFLRRYMAPSAAFSVVPGVTISLPLGRDLIGAFLVQLHQHRDEHDAAGAVAGLLSRSTSATLLQTQYALHKDDFSRAITLTEGVRNDSDLAVLLLAMRGRALDGAGYEAAALEVFKEGLRYPSRAAAVRHRVRYERGHVHLSAGRKAKARQDLERILAEDSSYMDVTDLLRRCS